MDEQTKRTILDALEREKFAIEVAVDCQSERSRQRLSAVNRAITAIEAQQPQQPVGVGMDMPDSPGWWAFEGKSDDDEMEYQTVHFVLDTRTGLLASRDNEFRPVGYWKGKWYRLTMPWDAQQPVGAAWQPVEYDDIFTPAGEPRSDSLNVICEKWYEFNQTGNEIGDHDYAICRRTTQPQLAPIPDRDDLWQELERIGEYHGDVLKVNAADVIAWLQQQPAAWEPVPDDYRLCRRTTQQADA